MSRERLEVFGVVLAVASLVAIVLIGRDVESHRSGTEREDGGRAARSAFCSALDGDIEVLIDRLGPKASADERLAARSTVGWHFNDAFVAGAPFAVRSSARAVVDAVDELRATPAQDPATLTSLRSDFDRLVAHRPVDCPP